MIRRPPRSTPLYSSAASDVYKRQHKRRALTASTTHLRQVAAYLFSYRDRFTGQQRLVDGQIAARNEDAVSRDTIAFVKDNGISAHHFATGNPLFLAFANDKGARA